MIEAGGHDGITKSTSLLSSICLNINILMVEASSINYNVLKKSRPYDTTINAALCTEDFVYMQSSNVNSGENQVSNKQQGEKVACTSFDKELHKIESQLGPGQNLKLIMMVLDIEGHEIQALEGLKDFKPMKADIETKFGRAAKKEFYEKWEVDMGFRTKRKNSQNDSMFGFTDVSKYKQSHEILYGARISVPRTDYRTSVVSPSYKFYGD